MSQPVFRFAPSPNGKLHLGHAYSALLNEKMAREAGGRLLLRIEDTDQTRCRPAFVAGCLEDLAWLGIRFEPNPRIQSQHFAHYDAGLGQLWKAGHVYPCFCSRKDVLQHKSDSHDPDGQPLYSGTCSGLSRSEAEKRIQAGEQHGWRLRTSGSDAAIWGDVMIAKRHVGSCYHIAVVMDDAAQGVTHVVRGKDIEAATVIHRLLQEKLGLPSPQYHHHELIMFDETRKLSKSAKDQSLAEVRKNGVSARSVRAALGFG